MKKILKWSLVLLPVLATGCKDDIIPSEPVKPAYSGDDVVFTFANRGHDTRTMYQDNWDEKEKQYIYWGNYLSGDPEQIKIYCRQAKDILSATYTVKPNATTPSHVAVDVTKLTEDGIQWSSQGKTYDFYAFYPAKSASNLIGDNGYTIQASVEAGQVPKQYKTKTFGSEEYKVSTLAEIAAQNATGTQNQTTVYAMPDMESAIMMAHTEVSGTPDEANKTGYGYPVSLDFNVLADVLDLTINGPVKPNSLGGNAGDPDAERSYIKIMSVDINNSNNGKKPLAGTFSIDMEAAAATTPEEMNKAITIITGTDMIQVTTADNGQYPTLHVRQSTDKEGAPAAGEVDQLRLRVFLLPGQVTNLDELEVTLHTDCGDYTQPLSSFAMVSGAIHPIKLSYFVTRGQEFDYKRWVGQLDDNIYLSELSIPGSWHSSNSYNQGSATLEDQYNAGVRAFEVHTTNGTIAYTSSDFKTELNANNAVYSENSPSQTLSNIASSVTGGNVTGSYTGTTATGTNMTVTQTKTVTTTQFPDVYLRLYRTRNVSGDSNPESSLSDAIIELAKIMNPDGLMFLELGMESQRTVNNVPAKVTTRSYTRTKTGVTLNGEKGSWTTATVTNVKWDTSNVWSSDDEGWVDNNDEKSETTTTSIHDKAAWAIAVETCLNRLKNYDNPSTGKKLLRSEAVTANTTIGDVRGQVIAKVNTNDVYNENNGWTGNTPALFSRWETGSADKALTVNLKWGKPIYSATLNTSVDALHWCYTELEAVGDVSKRVDAIKDFAKVSAANYAEGLHRTFYECSIGGYIGTETSHNTAANCESLAKQLNGQLLNILTDPANTPSPFGLVFMNYVVAPNGQEDVYHSKDLIRTIINNNAAFLLDRRGGSSKNVNDNTNSSFTNNSGDPLK